MPIFPLNVLPLFNDNHAMSTNKVVKNITAVLIGIFGFFLLEGVLLICGVSTLAEEDRFAGFSGYAPLFVENQAWQGGGQEYFLNPAKAEYFNEQSFFQPKPQQNFRVVALGGSTTYGRPWYGQTSFSHWLEVLLNRFDGQHQYEQINAGGVSYASYRVHRVMDEMISYDPDLFVVYSGHNEFLEARSFAEIKSENPLLSKLRSGLHHSRTYSILMRTITKVSKRNVVEGKVLSEEVADQLESVAGPDLYHRDPEFRQGVLTQYRASILSMVRLARQCDVPIVLCTLPSNLAGFSPFKSENKISLTPEEYLVWQEYYDMGREALERDDVDSALTALLTAKSIDSSHAQLNFYLGLAYAQLGENNRAFKAFNRAKEEDIVPLRVLDEMNQIIRDVGEQEHVPIADVEATFRRVSPDGLPGNAFFADHVHPTIEGQQLVSWVILETLITSGLVPLALEKWQKSTVAARRFLSDSLAEVPPHYKAQGERGVGRVLFWARKFSEAEQAYKKAWTQLKDMPDIPKMLGYLELYKGHGDKALAYFERAEAIAPGDPNLIVAMANAHSVNGWGLRALDLLESLPAGSDVKPAVQEARGRAFLAMKRPDEAVMILRSLAQLVPESSKYSMLLAEAFVMRGDTDTAQREYARYLELIKHPAPKQALKLWLDSHLVIH